MTDAQFVPQMVLETIRLHSVDLPSLHPSKSMYKRIRTNCKLDETLFTDDWFSAFFGTLRQKYSDLAKAEDAAAKALIPDLWSAYAQKAAPKPAAPAKETAVPDTVYYEPFRKLLLSRYRNLPRGNKLGPILEYVASDMRESLTSSEHSAYLVTGPPGSGKSTLLQSMRHAFPDFTWLNCPSRLYADDRRFLFRILDALGKNDESLASASLDILCDVLRLALAGPTQRPTASTTTTPVDENRLVIVLDRLDDYAQQCPRSLYALFDGFHSSSSQLRRVLIVAVSNRLDADSLLEKRIRSRFAFRHFMLRLPRSGEEVTSVLHNCYAFTPTERDASQIPQAILRKLNLQLDAFLSKDATKAYLQQMVDFGFTMHDVARLWEAMMACFPLLDRSIEIVTKGMRHGLRAHSIATLTQVELAILFALANEKECAASAQRIETVLKDKFGAGMVSSVLLAQAIERCMYLGYVEVAAEDAQIVKLSGLLTVGGDAVGEVREWIKMYPNVHTGVRQWANA